MPALWCGRGCCVVDERVVDERGGGVEGSAALLMSEIRLDSFLVVENDCVMGVVATFIWVGSLTKQHSKRNNE